VLVVAWANVRANVPEVVMGLPVTVRPETLLVVCPTLVTVPVEDWKLSVLVAEFPVIVTEPSEDVNVKVSMGDVAVGAVP
jgi:hypothetical protein